MNGSCHWKLNVADVILAFIYASISLWQLSAITNWVLAMNLLTLGRLIITNIKGSKHLREKYEDEYHKKQGLLFKSAYDYKLIIEACIVAFALVPFWVQGVGFDEPVVRGFAGVVIILGLVENYINIHTELFKASMDVTRMEVK